MRSPRKSVKRAYNRVVGVKNGVLASGLDVSAFRVEMQREKLV
jgi:hypothetical protein